MVTSVGRFHWALLSAIFIALMAIFAKVGSGALYPHFLPARTKLDP